MDWIVAERVAFWDEKFKVGCEVLRICMEGGAVAGGCDGS
jgi:hypothetical protein